MCKILFPYLQTRDRGARYCAVLWDLEENSFDKACLYQSTHQPHYVPQKRAKYETNEWVDLISRITVDYDYLMIPGHGQAHPLFWGLACSVGASLGAKSIGVARRLLPHNKVSEPIGSLGCPGLRIYGLETKGKQTGFMVRREAQKRGFYYSVGWRIGLKELRQIVEKIHRNHASPPFRDFARQSLKTYFLEDYSFSF